MNHYNYCANCRKWLGWPRYLVWWEKQKVCANCQDKKSPAIEIF